MDMGVYPGSKLKVLRNAPLEDPMEVELDGYFVSLRHDEARFVEVESIGWSWWTCRGPTA